MSGQPDSMQRRRNAGSTAAAEAARSQQSRAALRLSAGQSIVDQHSTRPILQRIMAKSPLPTLVKLGRVNALKITGLTNNTAVPSFYGTGQDSLRDIVDSGRLVFAPDDYSPDSMSFLADIMLKNQMSLTALQFHLFQLFDVPSDPDVAERCGNVSALLKISAASLKRIFLDASDGDLRRHDSASPEVARPEGDGRRDCVTQASMAQHRHAFRSIPAYAVVPMENVFKTLSGLLSGKFGQLPKLEELIIRWPTPWNLASSWQAPSLRDIFKTAPNLRLVILGQADLTHARFHGAPLDVHPLHLGPIGDDEDAADNGAADKIPVPNLQQLTFGKTLFTTPDVRRQLVSNPRYDRVLQLMEGSLPLSPLDMISGVLRNLHAPKLRRLNVSTYPTDFQDDERLVVLGYQSTFPNFPTIILNGFWFDARPEQRIRSSHGARRPAQRLTLLARVGTGHLDEGHGTWPYHLLLATSTDQQHFNEWNRARWCSHRGIEISAGDNDFTIRRAQDDYEFGRRSKTRVALLIMLHCSTPTLMTTEEIDEHGHHHATARESIQQSPVLTRAAAVKLVIQSVETCAVASSIFNLPANTQSRVTSVLLLWKLVQFADGSTKLDMQDCGDALDFIPAGKNLVSGLRRARNMILSLRRALPHIHRLDVCFHLHCDQGEEWQEWEANNQRVYSHAGHKRVLLDRAAQFAADLNTAIGQQHSSITATRSLPFRLRSVSVVSRHFTSSPRIRFVCDPDGSGGIGSFTNVLQTASSSGRDMPKHFTLEFRRQVRYGIDRADDTIPRVSFPAQ